MTKTVEEIIKKTEEYIDNMGEGGFTENDYTLDDVPYLFRKLSEEGILPKGPYVQVTSDGADLYTLEKTKFIIFDEKDNFVTYFKESDILEQAVNSDGFVNLNENGFKRLAEAYLKAAKIKSVRKGE